MEIDHIGDRCAADGLHDGFRRYSDSALPEIPSFGGDFGRSAPKNNIY